MVKAVFPGTFDPPTYGHLNIIERAAAIFDSLDVVIAVNQRKTPILSAEMRRRLLSEELASMGLHQAAVKTCQGLIVEYCRSADAQVLLRGVRSSSDFDYELELSILNKKLDNAIETILLPTEPKYFVLRSSSIRNLLHLGGDISSMVPPNVERALKSVCPKLQEPR